MTLPLPEPLAVALEQRGFDTLTLVQQAVLQPEMANRDLRITSKTGSGKTVAVGIAIGRMLVEVGPREGSKAPTVLVLAPTRELAQQVRRELAWLLREVPDAFVEVVTGGTSVMLDRKNLSRGPRVLVGTPGRILDHFRSGALVGDRIDLVVLDEADQMLDMGFRDELEAILEQVPSRKRTHLVSATFSGPALQIANRYQADPVSVEGTPLGDANADIDHVAHVVPFRHRYDALVNLLLARQATEGLDRVLVFTRTRADTVEISSRLQSEGFRAEPLSGELTQAARDRALAAFRAGRVPIVIATDVAARGLDVDGVSLVVHLDPPGDAEALTHRSGRTGRAGQKGTSVLLLPPMARGKIERMLREAKIDPVWAPVPSPDKIRKLFYKHGRRQIFAAFEREPDPEEVEYAKKLLEEHPAEHVIGTLLGLLRVEPPCSPRDVDSRTTGRPPREDNGPRRRKPYRSDRRRERPYKPRGAGGGRRRDKSSG